MPPKSKNVIAKEGRAFLAILSIEKQEICSIREAARVFYVCHTIIRRRLNGIINRAEKHANSHKLT